MSDDENIQSHTLVLLREMRAEMTEFRTEQQQQGRRLDEQSQRLEEQSQSLEEQSQRLEEQSRVLGKLIDAVTALAQGREKQSGTLGKIHEGGMIIERDLSAIKMRVERIERHIGLVQA